MKINKIRLRLAVSATLIFVSFPASAADVAPNDAAPMTEMPMAASAFDVSFTTTGVTDYRFRGISQTDRNAAIQGTVEATYSIFYAGSFVSNVDFGSPDPNMEVDVFTGIRPQFGSLSLDLGVVGYLYPNETADTDFLEMKAAGSYEFAAFTLGGAAYYSPDYAQAGVESLYVEANGSVPLPKDFSISGALGYQSFQDGYLDDYLSWNVGASYTLDDLVTFDVRYVDTDLDEDEFCTGTFACGSTVIGSITVATSLSDVRKRFAR